MSQVRVHNFSISLDGFGTGDGITFDAPFGHAGERLHEWMFATRFWRSMVGDPGGTSGVDHSFAVQHSIGIGAEVMGRGKFGAQTGPWTEVGTDDELMRARAREKLVEKRCDVIVLNDVGLPGIGFGSDDNAVTLLFAGGQEETLPRAPKDRIADDLWDRLALALGGAASRTLATARGRRHSGVVRPLAALASSRGGRGRTRRA